jgi:inositol phosphorylceramide mannosyltransferase catalytic subunit
MSFIPKIFHQTHASRELPPEVVANVEQLKSRNPEWQYNFYDDRDIVEFIRHNYDARIQNAYSRLNPAYGAARADFFRYLLMYRVGGLYLDIKSGASKSFDEIVSNHGYLLSHWDNGVHGTHPGWGMHFKNFPRGEFQQWYIAAAPGHVFLRSVIELVLHNIETYTVDRFGVGFEGVITTTGPVPYTLAIAPKLAAAKHHLASSNHQLGLVFNALPVEYRRLIYSEKRPHYFDVREPVVL